jgi:PAS domain S-box-containing protein
MRILHNQPISRKIQIVTLVACSTALCLMAIALIGFQLITFRSNFLHDVSAVSSMIAHHSTGAISFNDTAMGNEMLKSLEFKPHIIYAEIQKSDQQLFARYGARHPSLQLRAEGASFQGGYLVYGKKIVFDRETLGTVYLVSDYSREFNRILFIYLSTLVIVLGLSIGGAIAISSKLQRVVADPILNLAKTARSIADQRDYSVRAEKLENDEIGLFTDTFNTMLERIEDQDRQLRSSRHKVQSLLHSIEGIVLELDPGTLRILFVSEQAERISGLPLSQWREEGIFLDRIHAADRSKVIGDFASAAKSGRPFSAEFRFDSSIHGELWFRSSTTLIREEGAAAVFRTILIDVTDRKRAERELQELHQQLMQTSRQAGMAEIATGVLHNVGNVLNSVNVSATLIADYQRKTPVPLLSQVGGLLKSHDGKLGRFFEQDPRGRLLPQFIVDLADQASANDQKITSEIEQLVKNVGHIRDIVSRQQSYARVGGVIESIDLEPLVEDALQICFGSLVKHKIEIVRDFQAAPPVRSDKHKVLQIIVNLLSNAKHALAESDEKRMTLAIRANGDRVRLSVTDTGIGISAENIVKIFSHGFTTKRDGHGFGLHSGANAARELGGSLNAASDGHGKGATFTLDLPISKNGDSTLLKQLAASSN